MLEIVIPETTLWDEGQEIFIHVKRCVLRLEHSLVSVSKWESKWCKSYFSRDDKTHEEIIDYIRCMTVTKNVDPYAYYCLTPENEASIEKYINAPMTATTVRDEINGPKSNRIITAELVYCWMIMLNIPMEFQKWHFNKLMTLIKVCMAENTPNKKRSTREVASRHAAINQARRQKYAKKG